MLPAQTAQYLRLLMDDTQGRSMIDPSPESRSSTLSTLGTVENLGNLRVHILTSKLTIGDCNIDNKGYLSVTIPYLLYHDFFVPCTSHSLSSVV